MRGSIKKVQRKNGHKWRARIDLPKGPDGKRRQRSRTFETKKEANAWLARINHEINEGSFIEPADMPLREFVEDWLEEYAANNVKESTLDRYRGSFRRHILPALGDYKLRNITPKVLQGFYTDLLEDGRIRGEGGLSSSTVLSLHNLLHKLFETALKWRMIKHNPARAADPPKTENKEMEYFNQQQTRQFLQACEDASQYGTLLKFLVLTGLRRGEALGLRWKDVDFENKQASIRQTYVRSPSGEIRFQTPKSKDGERTVALTEGVLKSLRAHRQGQNKLRMKKGPEWNGHDHDLVFTNGVGAPVDPSNLRRTFDRILENNDLPMIRLHDLRHTHATLMLKNGEHPKVVSERLGHSRVQITLDRYSHVLPNMQGEAAQALEDSLLKGRAQTS